MGLTLSQKHQPATNLCLFRLAGQMLLVQPDGLRRAGSADHQSADQVEFIRPASPPTAARENSLNYGSAFACSKTR